MMSHLRRLLPLNRLRELDISALDKSVGGGVVAVVWQEVVVELPEHMQGDPGIVAFNFNSKVRKEASKTDHEPTCRMEPAHCGLPRGTCPRTRREQDVWRVTCG